MVRGPRFEELVAEALDSLPEEIAVRMDNVEVVIEDEPPADALAGMPRGHTLFGLYQGIPLIDRRHYDGFCPTRSPSTGVLSNVPRAPREGSRSRSAVR